MAMSAPSNKKTLYTFSAVVLVGGFLIVSLWYFRAYTPGNKLLETPPSWYHVISGNVGATTGFKVDLHPFRKYNGDVTLKNRPSEPQKTGLVSDKCGGLTKWAVITTIAPDTTETMTVLLEKAPEFCLLVVGDRKSPDTYPLKSHQDRCIYLTIDNQLTLSLDIISLTPENSFSRKNIGFLYAIANGAKVILDMDDDNVPIELGGKFFPMIEEVGTFTSPVVDVKKEGHVWNPYPHYGAAQAWPRGFPLDRIVPLERKLSTQQVKCLPIVQQYMANRDPDVDAIYRLSHSLPMDYISDKKRMVLPHGVFCPYNAQATMHLYKAFWSMLLPKTVSGRVSDIWRSYISEYVMSYIPDVCMMFAPPAVRHERNSHDYMRDFYSELPLYMMASQLVETLATHPPQLAPLQEVLRNTYLMLYEMGVLEEDDIKYVVAWINDLNKIGYEFPSL